MGYSAEDDEIQLDTAFLGDAMAQKLPKTHRRRVLNDLFFFYGSSARFWALSS